MINVVCGGLTQMPRVHCKTALRRRDFKEMMQSSKKTDLPSSFLFVHVLSCEAREGCCSCLGHSLPMESWQVKSLLHVSIEQSVE